MALLVIPESALRQLELAIANAARSAVDLRGRPVTLSTMESRALRGAACQALGTATGEVFWPGDEPLRIPRVEPVRGFVQEEG
jgi:hypothetical protein